MDKERLLKHLERKYSSKCEIHANIPLGVSPDEIWAEILQNRRTRGIQLPLQNACGEQYWYLLTNQMISASEVIVDELMEHDSTQEPHRRSVATIEEIYFTGFMEGAQISIQDAMDFLQSGEEPRDAEELILMNNRQAAGFAAENMYHAIDGNYLHNLAYFLTEGLDNGGGDYRVSDSIEIPSLQGERVLLPPADAIPELVEQFTAFLADTQTHPLIKSAAAQAWVLAVRPFPEGNERLARLLSSVILIRAGYSFFGDISISSVIARSSYDYFRAIANILRTENGADLTYFLEYYMTVLSAAVNDLRTKRDRQGQETIAEENRLARIPFTASPQTDREDDIEPEDSEELPPVGVQAIHAEYYRRISEALDLLERQGYTQFKSGDVVPHAGLTRRQTTRLLRCFEDENRIICVKKTGNGNVYTFSSEIPVTEAVEDDCESIKPNITKDQIITELQKRVQHDGEGSARVSGLLLSYIENGKFRFTSAEIAAELACSIFSICNYMKCYKRYGLIRCARENNHANIYEFAFVTEYEKEEEIPSLRPTSDPEQFLQQLLIARPGAVQMKITNLLQRYLSEKRPEFSKEDIHHEIQASRKTVCEYFRMLKAKGIIRAIRKEGHIEIFAFGNAVGKKPTGQRQVTPTVLPPELESRYSADVIDMVRSLMTSEHAPKDRRIGSVIYSCMPKGEVTTDDYDRIGAEGRMYGDMKFAEQLGLVKRIGPGQYAIMRDRSEHRPMLENAMKTTLTMMYDIFGDDAFSAEMVFAKLDYSESHMSATLHQLTWLNILECSKGEGKRLSYQFLVNPTDHPEYFEEAA